MKLAHALTVSLAALALTLGQGCGSDDEDSNSNGAGDNKPTPTQPNSTVLSASCEKYFGKGGCCEQAVAKVGAAAAGACDQAKSAYEQAVKSGIAPAQLDAQCKQGTDALVSSGSCK